MNDGLPDEELMIMYRDGDAQAFESLYKRHKGPLYRYVLRQCNHTATTEELFHDIWLKLINAKDRYTVSAKFTTYLYHLAHNRMIDYYRKQANGIFSSFEDTESPSLDDISDPVSTDPALKEDVRRQVANLLEIIEKLPATQREAFILHEEGGLGVHEIAHVTNVSKETAKSRLRYAINKIRHHLGGS